MGGGLGLSQRARGVEVPFAVRIGKLRGTGSGNGKVKTQAQGQWRNHGDGAGGGVHSHYEGKAPSDPPPAQQVPFPSRVM